MFVLRKEQLDAFKTASHTTFERELLRKLAEQHPGRVKSHGERATIATVRLGVDRAKARGLETEDDLMRYLGTMVLFGSYWEDDPQLAWAKDALTAKDSAAPERMARLWEQANGWRTRVMGPDDGLYFAALRSIEGKSVEDLAKLASRSQRDLLLQLAAMWPRKFGEAGEGACIELTRRAVEACRPFDLMDRWSVVLIVELMFLFGAGFLNDPFYEWAPEALKDPQASGIDQKLERLLEAARKKRTQP